MKKSTQIIGLNGILNKHDLVVVLTDVLPNFFQDQQGKSKFYVRWNGG